MTWLAQQPDTIFLGQAVRFPGNYTYSTLEGVPLEKRIELGVCEELQMGMTLGLALEGFVPVSIYPRMDFLLLGINQLVNHIDKIAWMSEGKMQPRIIIRTSVGPTKPLDAGPQHTGNYTKALRKMLTAVKVVKLTDAEIVGWYYRGAYEDKDLRLWLFIEDGELYNE